MTNYKLITDADLAAALASITGGGSSVPSPSNFNLKAWSSDPAGNFSGQLMIVATHYVTKVFVSGAQTITTVNAYLATSGVTAANSYFALYDNAGNLYAGTQSADISSTWNGAAGVKNFALGSSAVVTNAFVYVSQWVNSAGTAPSPARQGSGAVINMGLSAGVASPTSPRYGTAANGYTSSGTVAPATLGTVSTSNFAWVIGLS